MTARRRVLLDCDPGHDDALAILLAAASPALELVAITTVAGNQALELTTLNGAPRLQRGRHQRRADRGRV